MTLRQLIDTAPIVSETVDSVTKVIGSADAVMALPSPNNVARSRGNIVDVPVTLILSKSEKTPQHIVDLINASNSQEFLADPDNILLGLCLSGRGYPLDMYLHKGLFDNRYSSDDAMLENIFWHEFLHGFEGIYVTPSGDIQRKTPWSFLFQKRMQQLDALSGHPFDGSQYENRAFTSFVDYLHHGTDLQNNVSELFARVGVLMLHHIRAGGNVPQTNREAYALLDSYGLTADLPKPTKQSVMEAADIWLAVVTHGQNAQISFWRHAPKMISRAARLYGCDSVK